MACQLSLVFFYSQAAVSYLQNGTEDWRGFSSAFLHELIFLLIETLPPQTILALRFVQEGQKTAG